MKRLLFLLLLPAFSQAQSLPIKDGKVQYEQIDSISGASKNELYNRSKIWFVNTFKSAKDVLQLEDKENGQIIGKGNFHYTYTVLLSNAIWTCHITIQIDCRDNKARIKIYDISAKAIGEATAEYFNDHHEKKHIKAINDGIESIMADYRSSLIKPANDTF